MKYLKLRMKYGLWEIQLYQVLVHIYVNKQTHSGRMKENERKENREQFVGIFKQIGHQW